MNKTRRHRQRRNKLSRRMKKRGGAPKIKSTVPVLKSSTPPIASSISKISKYDLKKIQDHWIGLLRNTLDPSGRTMFNLYAYRRLKSIGYQGTWKNIRTNTAGNFISDEEMDEVSFLKKLKSVVAVPAEGDWIVKHTSASSAEWQTTKDSTPKQIREHDDYHSWLSTQNRDQNFWVPENVYNMIVKPKYQSATYGRAPDS